MESDAILNWPASDYSRIPFAVYPDESVYKTEQEKIFQGPTRMNYLALEMEFPKPGDFVTTSVGETSVIVNRDMKGSIRAFVNRCKHRGATLQRELRGNAKSHTCIYHQWTYELDGTLKSVPFVEGIKDVGGVPKDFDKSRIRLVASLSKSSKAWSLVRFQTSQSRFLISVNSGRDIPPLRALMSRNTGVSPGLLADQSIKLTRVNI